MEFRILGPLEIYFQDGPMLLSGAREPRLLALLLLSANGVVGMPSILDAVWDDDPPATAKRQVQNMLSGLRRRLQEADAPAGVLQAAGSGYQLRVADGELDSQRFQAYVDQAGRLPSEEYPDAADLLRKALRLWRGPALAGVGGRTVAAGAARLEEQRLSVYERCFDLELRLGRHDTVIAELTELVAAYPLRERLVGRLLRALYDSGRRSDALGVYGELRRRLADELGLDPSPELQRLHAAVLRDELPEVSAAAVLAAPARPARPPVTRQPATAAPPAAGAPGAAEDPEDTRYEGWRTRSMAVVPRQLPPAAAHFVGRRDELAQLDQVGTSATSPAASIVVITGPPGIGKTSTAGFWAHRVAPDFPDGQLYVNLRGFDPAGPPATPGEAIRGFLEALEVPPDRIPTSTEGQTGLYRSLVAGRRILVVLDNASSVDQVRPLLPGSAEATVVVTTRNQLTSLVTAEGAYPLTLGRLSHSEACELLARRIGAARVAAEPDAVNEIIERCGALPLAIAIVAARAETHPGFTLAVLAAELRDSRDRLDAFDGGDPAADVRSVFSWSYRSLSTVAARMFRLLGLHTGPDIAVTAAASLARRSVASTRAALSELVRAHLIVEHVPGRYMLEDLLRAYATELATTLDPEEARSGAIRRMLDHYLHSAYAADRMLSPLRDTITLDPPVLGVTIVAPETYRQAMGWFAAEHPVLLAAIDQAAASGLDEYAWRLAWTTWGYLEKECWHDCAATQKTALAAARRLADASAEAHAHRLLSLAYTKRGRLDDTGQHLHRALSLYRQTGDTVGEANTRIALGMVCEYRGRHQEALGHAQQALALFQAVGHCNGQAHALNDIGWCHAKLGAYRQTLLHCTEAIAIYQRLGNLPNIARTLDSLGYAHHHLGDYERAVSCYDKAIELFRSLGERYSEADTLVHLGDAYLASGDTPAAHDAWRAALAILTDLGHPTADQVKAALTAPCRCEGRAVASQPPHAAA